MHIIPINVDRNVSVKDYERNVPADYVLTYSMFSTIQGEGPFAGTPALFWRLGGCNLGAKEDCPWCDTKFDFDRSHAYPAQENVELINTMLGPEGLLVVVTGGEPLLQWDRITPVIQRVTRRRGLMAPTWQFETNGLLLTADILALARELDAEVKFVVSPKIPHNRLGYRPLPPEWRPYANSINLKYVVSADVASPYHQLPPEALQLDYVTYVSPMAVYRRSVRPGEVASIWDDTLIDREATAKNYAYAARLVMQHGLYLSMQTHLFGAVE